MYTRSSRHYGVWRSSHPSQKLRAGSQNYLLVLGFGICAFVSWLIFFTVFKIRGEFYFFETSNLDIPVATQMASDTIYFSYRNPAAAVGILEDESGGISLIFDDARVFSYPQQRVDLENYVRERSKKLELITMLTKSPSRTIGRVQFWVERDVHFSMFHDILNVFSQFGFDDFDLALTRPALLALGTEDGRQAGGLH
jgi:hypothetical protein